MTKKDIKFFFSILHITVDIYLNVPVTKNISHWFSQECYPRNMTFEICHDINASNWQPCIQCCICSQSLLINKGFPTVRQRELNTGPACGVYRHSVDADDNCIYCRHRIAWRDGYIADSSQLYRSAAFRTPQCISASIRQGWIQCWNRNLQHRVAINNKWRIPSSENLRLVALVRTDVLDESIASIIRMRRIGKLVTTLDVTSQKTAFFIVTAVKTSNLT
jgi:hypothetical protein